MLISYCTTCMGRLWQLRQTLEEHLKFFRGRGDVEFIVLDYNSPDGLDYWLTNNSLVHEAISTGLLVCVKEHTAQHYHSPKAKNLAHRMAKGNILFNLDADNWIAEIDPQVRASFTTTDRIITHAHSGKKDGTCGRIGLARHWFYRLGGYDESFAPMAQQDMDLLKRAAAAGLVVKPLTDQRKPIANTEAQKTALTGTSTPWKKMNDHNRQLSHSRLAKGELTANMKGWGSGTVSVNFGGPHPLPAIVPDEILRPPVSL